MGLGQCGTARAGERKIGQPHPGLFSQLQRPQSHVEVERQILAVDAAKRDRAAEVLAQITKLPGHFGPLAGRPDRVAQRDPQPVLHAIHHQRGVRRVEQEPLVPRQGGVGRRAARGGDDLASPSHFVGPGRPWLRKDCPQQVGQRQHDSRQGHGHPGPQRARGVGLQCEFPPQLIGVFDVFEREGGQPTGGDDDGADRRQPAGRKRLVQQGRMAIEVGPTRQQHHQYRGEQHGLLDVEPPSQRTDNRADQNHDRKPIRAVEPQLQSAGKNHQHQPAHAAQQVRAFDDPQRQNAR